MLWLWGLPEFCSNAAVLNRSQVLVYRILVYAKYNKRFCAIATLQWQNVGKIDMFRCEFRDLFQTSQGEKSRKIRLNVDAILSKIIIYRYTSVYIRSKTPPKKVAG